MAKRIPWNEYETAVLISACSDYNAGKCTKEEAIDYVSKVLRKRAEENGIKIDDVFRNKKGITMQFMLVNELLTHQKCGLRGASKLFINMIELYNSDRTKFQEILMEAKKTVGINKTNQEQFTEWLSCQLLPTQMSEIFNTYYEMDKYFQEENILRTSLLEIKDINKIETIKRMIMTNGMFRFIYREKIEQYSKAIEYYYEWLSEYCKDKTSKFNEIEKNDEIKFVKFGTDVVTYSMKDNKNNKKEVPCNKFTNIKNDKLQKVSSEQISVHYDNLETSKEWNLRIFLNEHNLHYVDKTNKGGCLWVLGGREIQSLMMQCWSHGISFRFRENGGNVTGGKPAWWAKLSEEQFNSWEQAYENNEYRHTEVEEIGVENAPMSEEEEQLAQILKDNYENGFRINSAIDRGRIKVFYNERFGKELPLSDEQIIVSLKKVGVLREDRIYAKQDDEQIDLIKQIFEDVMLVFENDASCVYPEAIYQKYQVELAERMQIYEAEFLGNTLIEMSAGKLRKKQTFLCLTDRQADLDRDVLEVLKKSPIPMTYADIQEVMWYIPLDKIKHVLVVTKSIVQVEQETYFYSMNLPISQDEITEVNRLIHQVLEHRSYITDVELRQLIDDNCPGIAINTSEFTTYGLRNCLGYILRDSYSFNGPIISSLGKELSMAEVFAQYCDDREQVTTEELKTLAFEMNTVIYWDSVRNETIRISEDLLLRYDKVDFQIDEIDRVLDDLCDQNYIPLKDIGLFMHFPALCVQWNGYVLESYIYKYSKKFKLLHASFSASGFFGAMVRQDSGIEDYRALIVDVLANSNKWEDKNSALELLVEQGYQQRRKYADIEKVVHEAKLLREKINAARK